MRELQRREGEGRQGPSLDRTHRLDTPDCLSSRLSLRRRGHLHRSSQNASRAPFLPCTVCAAYLWALQRSAPSQARLTPPWTPAWGLLSFVLPVSSLLNLSCGREAEWSPPSCLLTSGIPNATSDSQKGDTLHLLAVGHQAKWQARQGLGAETPPQGAQTTNRFPYFLICYPVAASTGCAHALACLSPGLRGASSKPGQGQGPSAPQEQCPVAALR